VTFLDLGFLTFAGNARDVVFALNEEGHILGVSDSVTHRLGYLPTDNIGQTLVSLTHPEDRDRLLAELSVEEAEPGVESSLQVRLLHQEGTFSTFEVLPRNLLATNGIIVVSVRDIEHRLKLIADRKVTEQGFEALAISAPIAIYRLDHLGRCVFANHRWTELTGQTQQDALGFGFLKVIDRNCHQQLIPVIDGEATEGVIELTMRPSSGGERSVIVRWTRIIENGEIANIIGTLEDVTKQKHLEAKLIHQATHDSLTGLPNRVIINEHLGHALELSKRNKETVSVVFCDLDRFKIVNDSLGHDSGDRLLVAVADRLRQTLRSSDVLGRFGGDEFVVISSYASEAGAVEANISGRIVAAFKEPFEIGIGRAYPCSASLGVSRSAPDSTAESLLRDADVAMYKAKETGRGRAQEFDQVLRARALDRFALESDLKSAISRGEMALLYQPILAMKGEGRSSVEALVRWDHPTRGRLSPELFVPIAEETGDILELGEWVLERACRDIKDFEHLGLNVNLSVGQVHDPAIADRVKCVLQRTGFPPGRLTLEITESVLVQDADETIKTLMRLKALGVSIAVDDFGTGYSSLSYLSRFPVDSLKVDRSFVQGLSQATTGNGEIVRAVISLAHALGLRATAEGVETASQLSHLRELGCDTAQGFLFDRPVELAQLRKMTDPSWSQGLATDELIEA
jgi:diguanylate cyclase (GGDEF)-like protein/PAS domain S-box-containing protein